MSAIKLLIASLLATGCSMAAAQSSIQTGLKIDSSNRTLAVSAEERIAVEPEIAILHIGFETPLTDAKSAYALGKKSSNEIISALKDAGIPDTSIRSESQRLDRDWSSSHRFRLAQEWVVRVPPIRAAEILNIAITAGATSSGEIEWAVEDVRVLEQRVLDQASARARSDAAVLAKGMGVRLGSLVYATDQVSEPDAWVRNDSNGYAPQAGLDRKAKAPPLAIEPRKVVRTANVYAVFGVE